LGIPQLSNLKGRGPNPIDFQLLATNASFTVAEQRNRNLFTREAFAAVEDVQAKVKRDWQSGEFFGQTPVVECGFHVNFILIVSPSHGFRVQNRARVGMECETTTACDKEHGASERTLRPTQTAAAAFAPVQLSNEVRTQRRWNWNGKNGLLNLIVPLVIPPGGMLAAWAVGKVAFQSCSIFGIEVVVANCLQL
jgi:hypothetical protein